MYHPIKNNNTFLLYKKGWKGINIDVDPKNIEIFNYARPQDCNINIGVSDKEGVEKLFFYHNKSSINTLNQKVNTYHKANISKVKQVNTQTLNQILDASIFNNIIKSDLFKFMITKNYTLANWLHSDLVFINNNFSD